MKLTNLDFSKPIYAHLKDGVHEVRFDLFDVYFVRGNYCSASAKVKMRIAGVSKLPKKIALTNDLDDAILDAELSRNVERFFYLTYNYGDAYYSISYTYLQDLIQFADFKYTSFRVSSHPELDFERWNWNGFNPVTAKIISEGMRNGEGEECLVFNAIKKEFYPIEGGTYATKEECAAANHIKVFTFED